MNTTAPLFFEEFKDRITWEEFNQNVHIDLVNKYVYVETPKVACSTIKARLYEHITRGLPIPKEVHPTLFCSPFVRPFQISDKHIERALYSDEYFRFSFVREPVERVLSAYLDKIKKPMPQRTRFLKRFYPQQEADYNISFEEFLDCLQTIKAARNFDKHWRPQHDLMFLPHISYHFIGSMARFEEDWKKLMTAIKLPRTQGDEDNVLWHATSAGEKVEEYVTDNIRQKITDLYKDDVVLYSSVNSK